MPWERDGERMEKFHYKEKKQVSFPHTRHRTYSPTGSRATVGSQRKHGLFSNTHVHLPNSHNDFSVLISAEYEEK